MGCLEYAGTPGALVVAHPGPAGHCSNSEAHFTLMRGWRASLHPDPALNRSILRLASSTSGCSTGSGFCQ